MESKLNNTNSLLNANETWVGVDEVCNGSTIILVNIISSEDCIITVKQTDNRTNYPFIQTINYYAIATQSRYQIYTNSFYCHVEVQNIGANPINLVLRTHFLDIGKDYSIIDPLPIVGDVVVSSIVAPLPAGTNSIGSVVISSSFSDIVIAGVTNEGGLPQSISVETEVRTNQTIYKLETYDYTANNTLTSIDSKVGLQGQNTDFAFFPDATNLTPAIYADGDQPVATNQAGWVYTNNGVAPNKINWYVFQDVTLPQYLVSEMDSIYFVISQLTPATTLPFVGFYTMPNGIDDVVPNFAKSRLVFAPSGSVPTAQGEYLFYVKSDPIHIRPEITNRYELTFSVANSSKTLEQASGERLSLATLSTNSTDTAGSNYFLFQQYGITWAKTSVPLPVNNGKVECNITLQPVTLTTGTADIGFVNLKAENLLSNPSTFSNLQMVGANLQVEDQGASVFLSSIDMNTNSINNYSQSIATYNQTMESSLGFIQTNTLDTSNHTDSINQKITACNTGAVVLTTGTADIGNVSVQGDDSGVPRKISALDNGGLYALQTNDIGGNFWLDTINNFLISNLSRLPIGSNYAETILQTYTNLSISGGYLYNLSVYSDGSSGTNFLKVYGIANATNADTPLLIVPVLHSTSVNLSLSGLKALTGISVRATANYAVADNNAPTNVISCNITFSGLS